jgi:anthranilate phosphoribosyltransferase
MGFRLRCAGIHQTTRQSLNDKRDALSRGIAALAEGKRLGEVLTAEAFGQLMRGEGTPVQAAALLTGLRVQGETADEVVGAVRAMRAEMLKVTVPDHRPQAIDTCGTGGGTIPTFNISTGAALVATAAGTTVAKHGNRSYTTKSGSADVLEALGVPITVDVATAERMLADVGMTFLFAPAFHPAMRHVIPVRRELGIATIMNVIGPLSNPAGVTRQVVGVADENRAPLLAEALCRLGAEHALVVHGRIGMDEISTAGTTAVWEVRDGAVRSWDIDPARYGLAEADTKKLAGGEPAANAERLLALFTKPDEDRAGMAAVLLNAGAALYVSGAAKDYAAGVKLAESVLRSGAPTTVVERLRVRSTSG